MAGKGMCSLLSLSPGRPRHPVQVLAALALACLLPVACEKETPVPPAGSARPAGTMPAVPPPEPEHTLGITSEPSGAAVKLNGQARGSTPLEIPGLRPGTYTLRLDKEGYDAWEGNVVVTKERAPPVEAALKRRVSTLSVVSVPPGATVLLDGEDVGVTPTRREGISSGKHTVTLRLQGYSDHSETRDLQTDKEMEVLVEMTFDPRRSEIARRIAEAGALLEENRAYPAWRILEEAEALPGWGEALTKEDERRAWSLHGQVKMVLPRASLQLLFQGREKALEDGLGPPDGASTVTAAKGTAFVDYEIRAQVDKGEVAHLSVVQLKRKKGSLVRVLPHELVSKEVSVGNKTASETTLFERKDSTRAGEDDILYCMLVSERPMTLEQWEGLVDSLKAPIQAEEAISWAREVFRRLEASRWCKNGGVAIRSILIEMKEA